MNLSQLTNSNLFILNSDIKTKDEAIRALVKKLHHEGKITSRHEFLDVVYEREHLSATGIEAGLAIPHGKSYCVKEPTFAVLTTKNPIEDWASLDPINKVQYVFLLAIPMNDSDVSQLNLLTELMLRMNNVDYKEKLFSSKTEKEFFFNLDNTVEEIEEDDFSETIVAVTSCTAGVAHTYMAAEALVKSGSMLGVRVHVEKQGANGVEGRLTTEQLSNAKAVIFATGVAVKDIDRFRHLPQVKVSVVDPIKDGIAVITRALDKIADVEQGKYIGFNFEDYNQARTLNHKQIIRQSVLTGISYMIPLVIAGGMVGTFSVLMDNVFDLSFLYDNPNSWLSLFKSLGSGLLSVLLLPVLSAYMAYSIGDKTALVAGYSAGYLSNLINGGFLSGMAGGLLAGYVVLFLKLKIPSKGNLASFISFWVYPVFSTFIVALLMLGLVGPPIAMLNSFMVNLLGRMSGADVIALGVIIGIMVSFDLGGPVNKAAYTFCVGAISEGIIMPYAVFASAKMVSGFAVTFATKIAFKDYSEEEKEIGRSTWILALAGITEGAIPFMMNNPINVIVSFCTGSAITGALVAICEIGLDVPGAGIFSIFMLQSDTTSNLLIALVWLGSAIVGAMVSAMMLISTKKRKF